jgi:hypothetical protein
MPSVLVPFALLSLCSLLIGCSVPPSAGTGTAFGTADVLYSYRGAVGLPQHCTNPEKTLDRFRGLLDDQKCAVSPAQSQRISYECRYPDSSPINADCQVLEQGMLWAQYWADARTYFDVEGISAQWLECRGANFSLDASHARAHGLQRAREIQSSCEGK